MNLKKITKITLLAYVLAFFSFILGYLIRVLASYNLDPKDVGIAYFIIYISSFFSILLDFGTRKALILLFSQTKDKIKKGNILFNYLIFQFINLFFILLIFLFIKDYIKIFFNLDNLAVYLVFLFMLVNFLINIFDPFIFIKIDPIVNNVSSLIRMSFAFLFFIFFLFVLNLKNYSILVYSFIIGLVFQIFFLLFYFLKNFLAYLYIFHIDLKLIIKLFKKGFYFLFIGLSYYLMYYIDSLLIGHFLPKEYYAYYSNAYSFLSFPNFLFLNLTSFLFPIAIVKKEELKNNLIKLIELLAFIVLPFSLAALLFSKEIILVLFSDKYLISSYILRIFSIFLIFLVLYNYLSNILEGLNKLKTILFTFVFVSLFNLTMDLISLLIFNDNLMKLELIAVVTGFSWLLLSLIFFVTAIKELGIKIERKEIVFLIKLLFINILNLAFVYFLKNTLTINNLWIKFLIVAILSSIFYFILSIIFKVLPYFIKETIKLFIDEYIKNSKIKNLILRILDY